LHILIPNLPVFSSLSITTFSLTKCILSFLCAYI